MELTQSGLVSFVESAASSFFPIQNLPYGVFHLKDDSRRRIGVAIGDQILDLSLLEKEGLLKIGGRESLFHHDALNEFASAGPRVWALVRARIQSLLSKDNHELQDNGPLRLRAFVSQSEVVMLLPFRIGGFSDFYASEHHATNVGKLFRGKENALLPNWKYLPVGYNGRASTVFVSGKEIPRPSGQIKMPDSDAPIYAPTKKLDFELEMGAFVGVGNLDGAPIKVNDAHDHLFGWVLLNDWSARDIQAFEYQPLGPFLSKSFATSISPWVVPMAALEEMRVPLPRQVPEVVSYLQEVSPTLPSIRLKVEIIPRGCSERTTLCETNLSELYWSMEQILAHHTVNHCIMRPGDLLGSGTISGVRKESVGSLLEMTLNGAEPIRLPNGETRTFLENGDRIIMTGYAEAPTHRVGFGCVEGVVSCD